MRRPPFLRLALALAVATLLTAPLAAAKPKAEAEPKKDDALKPETFAGLAPRSIGPAVTSGRIIDLAVDPTHPDTWWVATAAGGVWKTTNAGTTWTPVFDDQGSSSIGCLAIDPANPNVVWVGTGENNSQRSVGYGDGLYKTLDGGKSWKKLGLERSEHIAKIVLDPRDSDVAYVAAQGPLWSPGGDRGLYKTTDAGATWKKALEISENTGVSDVVLDPNDPDTLLATSYQRRRHVWTVINGGPESALHKSTDAGATWKKVTSGLPSGDLGRIGLAVSPADPERFYAIVEAARGSDGERGGGFYRSTDRGESWEKRSGYVSGSGQYYQEIFADPHDADRIYSMDVFLQVSEDGGKSFHRVPESWKHVDNHAMWIDPADPDHLINGNDGGVYESHDRGATWRFVANLPVTQFYKLAVDDALPFYNVYGGTQDNFTLGGPSRTASGVGIVNSDWFTATSGDGFQPRIEPGNPNVVYAQAQNGSLVRFDKKSGDQQDIQPQAEPGEDPLRWNWDSPLIISPHSPTRLYFAAQRVFRSDDRGDHWTAVSGDLTRRLDRNTLPVMGRVWGPDAVAKNSSTSFYGNIVSLSESPKVEGLLYAGTDDGLVQVSEDGGAHWRQVDGVSGTRERAYVADLAASPHDPDVVYAVFNSHKIGDFAPYVYRSGDRGRTWTAIQGDLPDRGSAWVVVEDPARRELLYAGTDNGAYFSLDGGKRWVKIPGVPTVEVRDLEIQAREGDLVLATFGRGFYVLDDLGPLRATTAETLAAAGVLFPVKDPYLYLDAQLLGFPGKGFMGDAFYAAPNPPNGAVFTYYLKEALETKRAKRLADEKKIAEKGGDVAYPSWDALRAEANEEEPAVVLTVTDEDGHVVRELSGPTAAGYHRVTWDLRLPPVVPASLEPFKADVPWNSPPVGPLVSPGTYRVALARRTGGKLEPLGDTRSFTARPLSNLTLPPTDQAAADAFHRKTAALQRAVRGASELLGEVDNRLALLAKAASGTPGIDPTLAGRVRDLQDRRRDLAVRLDGDPVVARYNEPTPPALGDRIGRVSGAAWGSRSAPTGTQERAYAIVAADFEPFLADLRKLVDGDLAALEADFEKAGAPYTPGRVPAWSRE